MSLRDRDRVSRFSAVYEALYGQVHAYAARRVGAGTADEVAAETFLVAWRRLDDMPGEPLPWLYGVARNVLMRHGVEQARQESTRSALRRERVMVDAAAPGQPGVWTAWAQMSPSDQEVLALIAWEELPVRDAARALGCSAAVFSVRLHRARRRFERLLGQDAQPSAQSVSSLSEVR